MRLLINLIIFLLCSTPAWANIWYVRDGGGTTTQCTGTTNAVYPGSGTGQNCAFNHPAWVTGSVNFSGTGGADQGTDGPSKWVAGDTMYIDGDSDINPGTQAQYMIGITMPNSNSGCITGGSNSAGCALKPIPAGISSSQMTTIIGCAGWTGTTCNSSPTAGHFQPQLWGTQGIGEGNAFTTGVLIDTAGNIDVENLEITQHSSCNNTGIYGGNPGYNGYPAACVNHDNGSYPYGTWAELGVLLAGTNVITKNNWWHNFALNTIYFTGNLSNWTTTNDKITGAGQALDGGDTMSFGGTNTMTNDVWAFGGCMEKYPIPDAANVKDLNNYLNCVDQGTGNNGLGGLGGGFMMQNGGNAACGNWVISGSQFLYNLKTNIDFLHCDGTGSFKMSRSRSEGSSSEALKLNIAAVDIENSQLIANSAVWSTAPYQAIIAPYDTGGVLHGSTVQICRGGHGIPIAGNNNLNAIFLSDDLASTCTDIIGFADDYNCGTNQTISVINSKLVAGYDYNSGNNDFVNIFLNDVSSCAVNFSENYNSMSNADNSPLAHDPQHCAGANDICSTNPQLLGSPFSSTLGPTAWGSSSLTSPTTSLSDQFYLTASSPLIHAGAIGQTYQEGANDYNNFQQSSPPDIGALAQNSCIANSGGETTGFCSISNQCCNDNCTASGFCGNSTCSSIGAPCTTGSSCCSGFCGSSNTCVNYICGDGIVTSPYEVCDTNGPNLAGQTCAGLGFVGGALGCSSGCLSFNTGACTPPQMVQHNGVTNGSTSTSSLVDNLPSPTGSGNLIVAIVYGATATGVTDGTTSFTQFPGTSGNPTVWYLPSSNAGKTAITANFSASAAFVDLVAWEVAGINSPTPDQLAQIASGTQSGGIATGAAITTTGSPAFVIAGDRTSGNVTANPASGNNFTFGGNFLSASGNGYVSLGTNSIGTYQPAWGDNGTSFASITVSFKASGSCTANGGACVVNSTCCANYCSGGVCGNIPPPMSLANVVISGNSHIGGKSVF